MRRCLLVFMVLGMAFMLTDTVFAVDPVPDIKANGSNGPITITTTDNLSITIELNPESGLGNKADWWVAAFTPFDWYYYDVIGGSCSWIPGLSVTYQGYLFDLSLFTVLNMLGLPVGTYTFYFAVDTNMNGNLDFDQLYYDSVAVNVKSESIQITKIWSDQFPNIVFNFLPGNAGLSGSKLQVPRILMGAREDLNAYAKAEISTSTPSIQSKVVVRLALERDNVLTIVGNGTMTGNIASIVTDKNCYKT